MPDEKTSDTEAPSDPEAGGRSSTPRGAGAGNEAAAGTGEAAPGGSDDREHAKLSRKLGVRHVTPVTVILFTVATLFAIALIVLFNLRSVGDSLEAKGLFWILPAGLLVIFGTLVVMVLVREAANLKHVEGMLDGMVDVNERLRLLMEAGREIGSTLDLPEILQKILDYTSDVTDADIGAVYLWEKSEDILRLAVVRGVDESKIMFKELPMKKGLMGQAATDRQMLAIDSTKSIDERDNVFFGAVEPLSLVLVPLAARDRFLGMLVAANTHEHSYSMDEKRLLDGLAELSSLAITNAELYRIARRSLDALSRERGVTDSVLDEMVAGVITADARGRIGVFNREAQHLTGYTFTEKTQVRLRPETSLDQNPLGPLEHGMLEVLDNPSLIREGDALVMKSDKALLPVSYRIYPLVNGPEVIGVACVFMEARGVSAEASAKGSVDYQVLLRSLGARVERVYTHPLSRVIERMRGLDIDDWSRGKEDVIRTLKAGYSTLLGLLEDLEQYLNCTTTREWDSPGECDLSEIGREVVREAIASPEAEGVTVTVKLSGLSPAFGFERMVRSALEQVIENACIAASFGGGRVEVTGRDQGSFVRIEVKDKGPGLDPETREFMFMPFFTVWEGRSGLGLSMVKRVMSRLGGRVGVEDVAEGALFYLEFPTSPGRELVDDDGVAEEGAADAASG